MHIVNSLIFGQKGHFSINGINVTFSGPEDAVQNSQIQAPKPQQSTALPALVNRCSDIVGQGCLDLLFQPYLHTFIHEMGHAHAQKALLDLCSARPHMRILGPDRGNTFLAPGVYRGVPAWKQSVIAAAGPMTNIAFSNCKLLTAVALQALRQSSSWTCVFLPVTIALYMGAITQIFAEVSYACWPPTPSSDFKRIEDYTGRASAQFAKAILVAQVTIIFLELLVLESHIEI